MIGIEIAGINISVSCGDARILCDLGPAYAPFLKSPEGPEYDIEIQIKLGAMPSTEGMTRIFESGESWSMFLKGDRYVAALNPPGCSGRPAWLAEFSPDDAHVTVYCGEVFIHEKERVTSVSSPFRYPLDQILFMYFLSKKQGAVLHAAGLAVDNRGYVFPGRSGAGKSTLTKQFVLKGHRGLLSDDRIVVREIDGAFRIFGTPWPGEGRIASNESSPLSGIYFLTKDTRDHIERIDQQRALERLLPVASIPWYDRAAVIKMLPFFENLVSKVPAFDLHFRPGTEVVDVFEKLA